MAKHKEMFFFTALFIALYYIRPFEFSQMLRGQPVMLIVGILAFIPLVKAVASGKVRLFRNGTDLMMVGFILAIGLSHIRHAYFGVAIQSMRGFLPVFIGYFIVAHSIKSERQLKTFIFILILCSTFLAIEGINQARDGISYFGVEPMFEYIRDAYGDRVQSGVRIKWLGTFSDPNDLALAFVLVVPFLINMAMNKRLFLPLLCLPLICYAIYLTNSRGGMLALMASIFTYFVFRQKSIKGAIVGLIFVGILMVLGPARMGDISASEGSAHGRLDAWYAGYQMFKWYPLFGVGQRMFADYHFRTAHNSFVLVFAELGILGTFFFVGMLYYPVALCYRILFKEDRSNIPRKTIGILSAAIAGLIGLMSAMFFLSRSYVMLPYMMAALSVVILNIYMNPEKNENIKLPTTRRHFRNIVLIEMAGIMFVNIIIKILL